MADGRAHTAPAVDEDGRALARLMDGFAGSQVTRVVALLGVPDALADGPRSAQDLAGATGAVPGPMARLLAAASVYGLVAQDDQGRFRLTSLGARLRSDVAGSMRATAIGFLGPAMWSAWSDLDGILRTGQPGVPAGDHVQRDPGDAAWFGRARGEITATIIGAMNRSGYQPPAATRIVDVGGGRGTLLASLLRSVPGATGAVLDRAEALTETAVVFAEAGVAGRAEAIAGSFAGQVPPGDLHVLCSMLHDWDDEHSRAIVAACHRASRPGGTLAVIGMLMPTTPGPSPAHLMDLTMMVVERGRERTLAELTSMMAGAGWEFARHVPLGDDIAYHVVEFRRT